MNKSELTDLINALRNEHSDNLRYEVKSAHTGFPESCLPSISAFCNTPGGGVLILGVDEARDFEIVGVYDIKKCQQTLANYAAAEFSSIVGMSAETIEVDGAYVVCAEIREAKNTVKPIEIKNTGKAYIRMYDGDYAISEPEKQILLSERGISRFDDEAVLGTDSKDLNTHLTKLYIENRRLSSKVLKALSDDEILLRTGVTLPSGELSIAGLLALGIYPQQYFPNYSIRASVREAEHITTSVRAANTHTFDGPIPMMLEEALLWVLDNCDQLIKDMPNGHVREISEYPGIVVRELISNALIHRDLNPYSMIQNITLSMLSDKLMLSNPGGLYGITVDDLGKTGSRTRNTRLAEICQYIKTEDGYNIIEKLGSGIPKIFSELSFLGLKKPAFIDGGLYFTVLLKSARYLPEESKKSLLSFNGNETKILAALQISPGTKGELEKVTGLTPAQLRYSLKKLIDAKKIAAKGKKNDPYMRYFIVNDS